MQFSAQSEGNILLLIIKFNQVSVLFFGNNQPAMVLDKVLEFAGEFK